MNNIVIFQLITGIFVTGKKNTELSNHETLYIDGPIEFIDMMTQHGPQKVPVPYGAGFYDLKLTEKPTMSFSYNNMLTGPLDAPEKIVELWTQMTSIVKPVENKIQLATS